MLQFVSFPKVADPQPVELVSGERETISVDLPTNSISKAYKVKQLSKWMLGKTVTDEKGQPSFKTYGETPSIASNKQLILVIRQGATDSEGLTLVPFDSRETGFVGGKYLLLNGTKVDIGGTIGNTSFALKPLMHTMLAPGASETKDDRRYLYTQLYFRKGDGATPFYSSTWRLSDKARSMVFFYHDPFNDRLRVHTIRDYLP